MSQFQISLYVATALLSQWQWEASRTIWACDANISVFIERENNSFLFSKEMNIDNDLKLAWHDQIVEWFRY
jgi:hypothetical protein